jgi:hypothetical protein
MLLLKLLSHSFTHANTGECDKQNISNLELALFHLKHNVSTKQLTVTDLSVKSDLDTGILE